MHKYEIKENIADNYAKVMVEKDEVEIRSLISSYFKDYGGYISNKEVTIETLEFNQGQYIVKGRLFATIQGNILQNFQGILSNAEENGFEFGAFRTQYKVIDIEFIYTNPEKPSYDFYYQDKLNELG